MNIRNPKDNMDNLISTERKEFIMKNFSTVRGVVLRQLMCLVALVGFLNTGLIAQCNFTSTCPGQVTQEVAANGDCEVMVELAVPTNDQNCIMELFIDGVSIGTFTTGIYSHLFPIGASSVLWQTDSAIPDECSFVVNVTDIGGAIESISCNDFVQVSLGDDCTVEITPDMITEGGPYGCFDLFEVQVQGLGSNIITSPGTYTVTVTSPIGNSCWGVVTVEDKVGPVMECKDAATYCSQGIEPGDTVCEFIKEEEGAVDDDVEFMIATANADAIVKEVKIEIDITTTHPSELSGALVSPEGTVIDLFSNAGGENGPCTVANMHVSFSDEGHFTQADLFWHCGQGVLGITGSYLPIDFLSLLNGEDPNGAWVLELNDTDGSTPFEAVAILTVGSIIDTICFPIDVTGGYQIIGENQYLVGGYGACGPIELLYQDNVMAEECSSPLWETIERTWLATDPAGNQSSCLQIITVERPDLSTIEYPKDWDGFEYPPIDCYEEYDQDANGHPHPSWTGYPAFPSGYSCPNIQMTYEDLRIDICPTAYKLIRTWSLLDWCTGEVETEIQIIKVVDDTPPYFTCPLDDEQEFYIQGTYDCLAEITLPAPTLDSLHIECSETTWRVKYKSFYGHPDNCFEPDDAEYIYSDYPSANNTITIEDLPKGCTWILYVVEDACGNRWEEECKIHILDGTPPIAVCIENTVAAIGASGCLKIYAESFDNGSHDNCQIERIDVRRMDSLDPLFYDYVKFCCEDIPTSSHMVQFRVTDKAGLSNICMVEVNVQDKLPPVITCPDDVEIECSDLARHPDYLGYPDVVDNIHYDINGDPLCPEPVLTWQDFPDLNQCGVGHIRRRFRAEDPTNPALFATCIQYIYVYNYDPLIEEYIEWPHDHEVTDCDSSLEPEDLEEGYGFPLYPDDECSLVATTWEDQVFEFVPGSCVKILRTWTVIDWCQYEETWPQTDPNNNGYQDGIWEHVQVIKLNNLNAPEFESCLDTVNIAGYGMCEEHVLWTKVADDDCTPDDDLNWEYHIDLYNDGGYDYTVSSNTIDRILPFGCHKVKWIVEDYCGNVNVCEQILCVNDEKNPTPYCISEITTVVMNNNGEVEIWANDFDFGSTDNCGPIAHISFSSDIDSTYTVFDCDDLPNGVEAEIEVQVWFTDQAGNQDFCEVTLILQDNEGDACEDNASAKVTASGTVRTEDNRMVESAEVLIMSDHPGFPQMVVTPENGTYAFDELDMNIDYSITASRGEDWLNGVSTLDIVNMQKHILGITPFDSPYKIIASDVDGSQTVSAIDLVNLRKLILGAINSLPNNQPSWKFVDADQIFFDDASPWPINESVSLYNLNSNMSNQDLIAVKMGDVTYNASASGFGESILLEDRSSAKANFEIESNSLNAGETTEIPVFLRDLESIIGFQYTLNLGTDLSFNALVDAQVSFTSQNYAEQGGMVYVSWDNAYGTKVNPNEALFYISVTASKATSTTSLTLNSDNLSSEIYDEQGVVYDLKINNRDGIVSEFVLLQNTPNPFTGYSNVNFSNPNASNITLTITDVQGKVVMTETNYFEKGNHTIRLDAQKLSAGILYYTLESDTHRETMRMIVIK